jgi:hypothetical protein
VSEFKFHAVGPKNLFFYILIFIFLDIILIGANYVAVFDGKYVEGKFLGL